MKKLTALTLIFVILLSSLTVGASVSILYGDVNADGKINNKDLGLLQQYLNGWDVQLGPTGGHTTTSTMPTTPPVESVTGLVCDLPDGSFLIVRQEPDVESTVVDKLHNNDVVQILSASEEQLWYQVKTPSGIIGWCRGKYVRITTGTTATTGITATTSITYTTNTTKPTASATTQATTTATATTTPTGDSNVLNQVPDKLDGTKIKMLIWWNQATDDTKEAEEFKKATGISVAYESAAMDKYQSNLSGKIMAGNPPALAAIINEWYPQPITRGLMQPIKNTGWDYSDPIYAKAMMDQFGYKGEHYGIALKGSNMVTFEVMFFNKKLLKANGVTKDPYQLWQAGQWNWDTCLEIAQKCTNAKKDKYGLTLIYQNYWMLSAGQDFVVSDADEGIKNNIKSSKLRDAWVYAWEMIYTHKVIPTMFRQQQTLFFDGSVAMLGGGSYFMEAEASHSNYVPQNCTFFEWDVVPFPSPKGQAAVAACEGVVWGFPTKVKGNQMQAGMWFLRYYLDDATYGNRDFYPDDELGTHCWDVMGWMWNQKIQSFNSVGVITYCGKHNAASVQYSLIDQATTTAQVAANLDSWYAELEANINQIKTEMS